MTLVTVRRSAIKMDDKTCSICGRPLIKQPLKDGRPLTEDDKREKQRYDEARRQTLQCKNCGEVCYNRNPPPSGEGLCRRCGGSDLTNRPKDIEEYRLLRSHQYAQVWSCPVHGCDTPAPGAKNREAEKP